MERGRASRCGWGGAGLAWLAGRRAFPNRRPVLTFLSGSLIWSILLLVPVAGAIVLVAALVLSIGVVVAAGLGASPHWFSRTVLRRGRVAADPHEPV